MTNENENQNQNPIYTEVEVDGVRIEIPQELQGESWETIKASFQMLGMDIGDHNPTPSSLNSGVLEFQAPRGQNGL